MYKYTLFLLLLIAGCDQVKSDNKTWEPKNLTDAKEIAESLSSATEEEKRTVFKQYSGIAECLKNCDSCFTDLLDVQDTIERFHSDFNYENNEKAGEVLLSYLSSKGVDDQNKNIVDKVENEGLEYSRSKLIEVMQTVADGARLSLETKNEP